MARQRLTPKQARFVEEYLVDLNATQAAVRAGYSARTAYKQGPEQLQKPVVAEAIQKAKEARGKRTEITANRVLEEIARIAFFDIRKIFRPDGTLIPIADLPEDVAAAIAGCDLVTVSKGEGAVDHVAKVKVSDKLGALTMLAKHLGLAPERMKHEGSIKVETEATQALDERLKELMTCIRKG